MKKPLLITTTLVVLALSATSIYAQVSGSSSLITKMKAAAANFTLASELNPGQTGLQSAPISGKKTGDILTAGEWNRVLELLGEGGSGGGSASHSGWENVPLTGTENFDDSCMYRYQITYTSGGREPYVPKETYYYVNGVSPTQLAWWLENDSVNSTFHIAASSKNLLRINGTPYTTGGVSVTKIEKLCGGGGSGGGSGWENVSLTDTADYDTACVYEVQFKTTDSVNNNLLNGDTSWRTGTIRGNKYLGFAFTDGSATAYSVWGVPSSSKSTYGYRDSAGTFVPSSGVSILGMRRLCGGGGSGSGSGWEDVSLTDTADFDKACEYRFYMNAMGLDAIYYVNAVAPTTLIYISHNSVVSSIPSNNKTSYQVNGSPAFTVSKIQKLCGGGGSGGTSNITWANFDGSGSVAMKGSNGISSIVRESAGNYRVTFSSPRPNTDYGVICTSGPSPSYLCFPHEKSTTSFLIKTSNPSNNVDAAFVSLIVTPFDVGTSSGGSGSGGGAGWEDVSLTDTADFDKSCEYRYQMLNPPDDPYMGNDPFKYIIAVDNNRLTWLARDGAVFHHINSDSRTVYRVNGVPIAGFTISKLQKRCGGGGSSSSSGWSDIVLGGSTPFNINCEYRFKASAPGNTDDDAFIGDDNAYNYIQRVHANRLTYQHIGTSYEHINADTKTTLRQNGLPVIPFQTITQIQQRCD